MSPKTAFIGLTASFALVMTVLFAQAPAGQQGQPGQGQRQGRGQRQGQQAQPQQGAQNMREEWENQKNLVML